VESAIKIHNIQTDAATTKQKQHRSNTMKPQTNTFFQNTVKITQKIDIIDVISTGTDSDYAKRDTHKVSVKVSNLHAMFIIIYTLHVIR
jgi:hypothetical protein